MGITSRSEVATSRLCNEGINTYCRSHILSLHYLLTPCSKFLLCKLTVSQLVTKFPAFYGFRQLITVFATAGHLSLSWARSIQCAPPPLPPSSSYFLKIHFINFILPHTSALGCPSCIFPQDFPTKPVRSCPLPHSCHMLRPFDSSLFGRRNTVCWDVQIMELVIMQSCCVISPRPS